LIDCAIPKTNYLINQHNNNIVVNETSGARTITLEIGNYTRRSFKTQLQSKLNNNLDGFVYSMTFNNIGITFDNGHYYFSYTGGTTIPSFEFDNSGLYEQMGFNPNMTYPFVNNKLESVNCINFKVKNTFYILSNIVQNKSDNILQNVYSQANDDFEYINFHNMMTVEYSKDFIKSKSNTFYFKIVDEDFNLIDINSSSTSGNVLLTLLIYKEDRISDLIKGYIKYRSLKDTNNNNI
jgi:hypothetical protein